GAVRAEGERERLARLARQGQRLLARPQVPESHAAFLVGGGQPLTVRAEGEPLHPGRVAFDGQFTLAAEAVPHDDLARGGPAGDYLAVPLKAPGNPRALPALQPEQPPPRRGVPPLPPAPAPGDATAVGAEGDRPRRAVARARLERPQRLTRLRVPQPHLL